MRSFLKIFFACLFAIVAAFLLFFFFIVGGMRGTKTPVLSANSVLNLTLHGEITDRAYNNPFRNLSMISAISGSITDQSTIGLFELKEVLKYAKSDDHIKGIYLNLDEIEARPATLFELRNALIDFKKSGKFIYAYANDASEKNLLLDNAADKFYINPLGACEFDGFAIQRDYLKGLYDKLNVEFKVFYVGEYKSATESFRRTDMSPEDRLQSTALLNSISGEYLKDLQESTSIPVDSLKTLQDNLSVMDADEAVHYGLADGIRYESEVMDEIKAKLGYKKTDDLKTISYDKYKEVMKVKSTASNDNKIAVVYAEGEINDSKEEDGTIGGQAFVKILKQLEKDDKVKGVVLRVNSPGGSAFASEQINHEVQVLKKLKPVVVSMGDYAASGGYYISAPANKIIAQPNTITGSIGIFGIIPNIRKALNEKLGVTFDEVKTAKHANFINLTNDWDDVETARMQQHIEKGYQTFVERVASGRKMDTAAVNKVARGRVWTGQDALKVGLVDELGGMELAVQRVKELAKIKNAELVTYPKEKSLIESVLGGFMGGDDDDQAKLLKNLTPQLLYMKQLERLQSLGILQYKMPYDINVK